MQLELLHGNKFSHHNTMAGYKSLLLSQISKCMEKYKIQKKKITKTKTRNLLNGYITTAGGVQEMELNTQTKHCSTKSEKPVKVNNSL